MSENSKSDSKFKKHSQSSTVINNRTDLSDHTQPTEKKPEPEVPIPRKLEIPMINTNTTTKGRNRRRNRSMVSHRLYNILGIDSIQEKELDMGKIKKNNEVLHAYGIKDKLFTPEPEIKQHKEDYNQVLKKITEAIKLND